MATAPQITELPSFVAARREVRRLRDQGRRADAALAKLADDLKGLGIKLVIEGDEDERSD
jgi:hypothetical protein